jgi:hypothetical protein
MVDILDRDDGRQFGSCARLVWFAEPVTKRSEPGEPAAVIYKADVEVAEAHDMIAGLELGYGPEMLRALDRDNAERLFPRFKA